MAFLKSSELFTYVMESGAGTFSPAVSATDTTVRLREMDWTNENDRDNDASEYMNGSWFGSDESIVGMKKVTANYSMKVAPGEYTPDSTGSAGDAEHKLTYSDLLANCGMTQIAVSATANDDAPATYVFYPDQAKAENTMSVAQVLYDGEADKYQVAQGAGAVSNFSFTAEGTAMPWQISFETQARAEEVIEVDGAVVTIASFDETSVMRTVADSMRNTTIKITDLETDAEVEFCVTSLNMESGNELNMVECQNNDSGIKNYIITKVNPSLVIDPLLRTLTDFNWWNAVSSERFYKVEIDSEYTHVYIPRAQINANSVSESNGSMRNELTFRPLVNIDGDYPSDYLPVGDVPTNVTKIPYFLAIEEREAQY